MKNNKIYTCYGCPQYFTDRNEYQYGTTIPPTRHCDIDDKWKCNYFNGKLEDDQIESEDIR